MKSLTLAWHFDYSADDDVNVVGGLIGMGDFG